MDSKVNSADIFSSLFFFWRTLGFTTTYNKYLIALYDAFVTTFVTFAFPAHLLLGAAFAEKKENIFINLAIGISAIACTFKHFLLRPQLTQILFVNDMLQQLDERVQNVEDIRYYVTHIRRRSIFMMRFFTVVYFSVAIMAVLSALWSGKILYPAYVIIDWHSSTGKYLLVMLFQVYGLTMQIIQNLTNDTYGPMVLCLLSGHVHLLARRVARIGHDIDGDTVENSYRALVLCIEDYKLLMSTTKQVERIISSSYMVQFTAVGINVVVGLIYMLFFADNLFAYGYYIFHILAIMIEIFPCCYYGSLVQAEFHALSYAIFRCNWLTQPREFRRNLITFVELSLYEVTVSAGGMMRIHLDSFFKTCKMGYSFFTVIQSMK
ncbi:PREDICTED: odorant receptor 33b-like [Rhagoletis zephyria]|uniref:odorant receptor 33b-like n=1 Tax=Rhagoletis zephyria TaxID=28612 RepID=UPI00081176FB|nr:PREDICTED: odorant receptor 33b-like [Rhagoletis zephyria]